MITLASAYYQRLTGPTYPISGETSLGENDIAYTLERSHGGGSDHQVQVLVGDSTVAGMLLWKRHKVDEPFRSQTMTYDEASRGLRGDLPGQPPGGKLDYVLVLRKGESASRVPPDAPVTIRFKGGVPAWVLILHVVTIFFGMLFSSRTGLEFFGEKRDVGNLTVWTLILLTIGGMVLGPVVQKYAFGEFWTGFPFGMDLTDNKTLIAVLAWSGALVAVRRRRHAEKAVLAAAIITLVVFLIPHSLFGTELDYNALPSASPPVE
jgi:hypothetical protein